MKKLDTNSEELPMGYRLEVGDRLIISHSDYYYSPFLIKIISVTKTTLLCLNEDEDSKFRITKDNFERYHVVEILEPCVLDKDLPF